MLEQGRTSRKIPSQNHVFFCNLLSLLSLVSISGIGGTGLFWMTYQLPPKICSSV